MYFSFCKEVSAVCDPRMIRDMTKKLWHSFCLKSAVLTLQPGQTNTFVVGEAALPALPEGKEYAISVEPKGAAVVGRDYGGLMRGFFVLLMKIRQDGDGFQIPCGREESGYQLENRMIHICVFPENDLYFIKKLIRLSALCQYTHIVIEFWGMLQYDCLKELAWPNALTKDEARELIRECRELGMEPIPMFNQLGHATASRVCYGKHVVLDQNPGLQRLFTPDGWAWNICSAEVKALLKAVRMELYELFGEGLYMHIGCDEAYFINRDAQIRQYLPGYMAELTRAVEEEGRRPMIWMDMFLTQKAFKDCYTVGAAEEVEGLRNAMSPNSVFVDWQYNCNDIPIPSLESLKNCGRDVMGAPWYEPKNYAAHIQTVVQNQMFGVMMTTWHTLKQYMPSILGCAKEMGVKTFPWTESSRLREETATLMRRVSFEGNTYADCGWSKTQIEV